MHVSTRVYADVPLNKNLDLQTWTHKDNLKSRQTSTHNIDITSPASPFAMSLTLVKHPVSFVTFYVSNSPQKNKHLFTSVITTVQNILSFFSLYCSPRLLL